MEDLRLIYIILLSFHVFHLITPFLVIVIIPSIIIVIIIIIPFHFCFTNILLFGAMTVYHGFPLIQFEDKKIMSAFDSTLIDMLTYVSIAISIVHY
jgi:hypothetical protein